MIAIVSLSSSWGIDQIRASGIQLVLHLLKNWFLSRFDPYFSITGNLRLLSSVVAAVIVSLLTAFMMLVSSER